jgi:quinol monooxygenase YgiN
MAENYHNVVALIKIKPENIKDAEPLVKELADLSRKEPGVVKYEIYRVKEKEGVYVILELFKTEADFHLHRESEHNKTIIEKIKPFFLEPPNIVSLEKEQI